MDLPLINDKVGISTFYDNGKLLHNSISFIGTYFSTTHATFSSCQIPFITPYKFKQ